MRQNKLLRFDPMENTMTESVLAFCAKVLSMLAIVLMPIRSVMISVGVLVLADLVTGIWASMKQGETITSKRLKTTVIKTLAYQGAIVVGFIIETYLVQDIPIVKVVSGLIGLTEGKSFFENLHRITGIDFMSQAMSALLNNSDKILPAAKKPDSEPPK